MARKKTDNGQLDMFALELLTPGAAFSSPIITPEAPIEQAVAPKETLAVAQPEPAATPVRKSGAETLVRFFDGAGNTPRAVEITFHEDRIDIFDIDHDRAICLDMHAGKASTVKLAKMFLPTLDWSEFTSYMRARPEYTGGIPDIDKSTKIPGDGNRARQAARGLAQTEFVDIRPQHMIEEGFPAVDRAGAIRQITDHATYLNPEDGRAYFCWDVSIPEKTARMGRPADNSGEDVDPDLDDAWRNHLATDDDAMERIMTRFLEPHLSDDDMDVAGTKGDVLILSETFAGDGIADMGFTSTNDVKDILSKMDDLDIAILWAKFRTLDALLTVDNRRKAFLDCFNEERAIFEAAPILHDAGPDIQPFG